MNGQVLLVVVLSLACFALLGWALVLRRRPPEVRTVTKEIVRIKEVPVVQIKEVIKEVEVIREVVKEVPVPVYTSAAIVSEPEIALGPNEYLTEPQALPDVPDAVHDTVFDGARFGGVVVRAASIRGDLARRDARLRRQSTAIALLSRFGPPVLLSVVAAGDPRGARSQVGAAQVCRSVQVKISDRAYGIDAAWTAVQQGDTAAGTELTELLREVTLALRDSLTLTAQGRNQPESAVATELTGVLSRLGDMRDRPHLAFGVGASPVLRVTAGTDFEEVFRPATAVGDVPRLPQRHDLVSWQTFTTAPGETVIACTAGTAEYLRRDQVRERLAELWSDDEPPGPAAFLSQLGAGHQAYPDDRTAVAVWNGAGD
ncbi:hypothetical protein FHR83_003809 [Actinoplanes campanulatus]|uniref:Uncharacterized protein n=1 Tax=Actinoplanes campanulatus TaxID=113559 RepID=A0A7W5AHN8_9ACTN|nr:protein phosphatase 2C domain-containing protein [Actinoplanes campanulatus]MBB3096139.1 hypothetical protein [Actinoplanes campanulatus]GGN14040.1 hypothetical protein GCM10010109_25230 [Actinoplanes campanulatus]GID36767.1 hypothetical protein Aca09nite_32730 [Actinoplanes campanulatus]